ncbi:hypothetical protein PC9H_000044 [Pleurotus ostreatus]|uniref:Uncharacterized protein n=3 Tax=Pleurotus ostreatus TaxID=5322 RepID=A0A8H7DYV7_PLEOS|nr:uncharacterized protein PC9H_004368 [Pleurotus ostreatus]XP_036635552.1 uncharacterized protein PC9H_000044 [Pleurotus ostreatus]KAF7437526.1 hypothetical protein PC9H_004368 [Pleurotus ostreatus]KAF7439708.1 hypothetical protein PC9H_000044 [Pleurotus ostreatus]KDQ32634.1 hypothetical protein PLEOSDRAFT_1098631 [Pleurotus ostreatus PC15]
MAPPSKVNAEQKAFLESLIDTFLENRKKSTLHKFWPVLYRQWFERYPIVEDTSIQDAEERRKDLAAKVEKKREYLNRWYHNHASAKVRAVVLVTHQKKTRRPQLVQMYCKKYYSSRIKPLIVKELNGKVPTRKEFLALLHVHSTAAFDDETPAVKAQMNEEYQKRLSEPVEEPEEEITPSSYAAAIKSIPIHFNAFAQELNSRTGWSFTLFAGGPDPTNGGRINTAAFHSCENMAGLSFSDATPNFTSKLVTPFATFLRTVYTPEDCASRALNSTSQVPRPIQPQSEPSSPAEMPHSAASPIATITSMALTLGNHEETDLDNDLWQDFDPEQALAELTQTSTIPIGVNGFEGLGPPGKFPSMVEELFAPLPGLPYHHHAPLVTPPVAAFTPPTFGSAATAIAAVTAPTVSSAATVPDTSATSAAIDHVTLGTREATANEPTTTADTSKMEPAPTATSTTDTNGTEPASTVDANTAADGGDANSKRSPRAAEDPDVVINTMHAQKPAAAKEAPTAGTNGPPKRKRTCKAGEDPDLIVTTKRVRKPAPSKEIEATVIARKGKENK